MQAHDENLKFIAECLNSMTPEQARDTVAQALASDPSYNSNDSFSAAHQNREHTDHGGVVAQPAMSLSLSKRALKRLSKKSMKAVNSFITFRCKLCPANL